MNLQNQLLEINKESSARHEKQLQFNYDLMKRLDENQEQIKELYELHQNN